MSGETNGWNFFYLNFCAGKNKMRLTFARPGDFIFRPADVWDYKLRIPDDRRCGVIEEFIFKREFPELELETLIDMSMRINPWKSQAICMQVILSKLLYRFSAAIGERPPEGVYRALDELRMRSVRWQFGFKDLRDFYVEAVEIIYRGLTREQKYIVQKREFML